MKSGNNALKVRAVVLMAAYLCVCFPLLSARDLKDELGRTVHLPDHPQRVVCLAPNLTETVYALGMGNIVAGVTDFTDDPPEARTKPSVGGLTDASLERIVALRPDLVLAMGHLNREETVNELERVGIPVFVVSPQSLQDILESIVHLGNALNCAYAAEILVKRLKSQQAAVAARVAGRPRPKVLMVVWYDPVVTAGDKSFITDVVTAAGGQSVTADLPQAWPQISLEEVVRRSPDFLLLVRAPHGGITEEDLASHAGWDRLAALKSHRVIYMDERFIHPSPVVFEALEFLAKQLHPEAF
jgi:iron complex transport system substrate-binding protein